jgi:hypothetical protein
MNIPRRWCFRSLIGGRFFVSFDIRGTLYRAFRAVRLGLWVLIPVAVL